METPWIHSRHESQFTVFFICAITPLWIFIRQIMRLHRVKFEGCNLIIFSVFIYPLHGFFLCCIGSSLITVANRILVLFRINWAENRFDVFNFILRSLTQLQTWLYDYLIRIYLKVFLSIISILPWYYPWNENERSKNILQY